MRLFGPTELLTNTGIAIPRTRAGVVESLGFVLRPDVRAVSVAGSSIIVALNAVALKRLRLPQGAGSERR